MRGVYLKESGQIMEKRILPDFKSEAEEAKWWFDNRMSSIRISPALPPKADWGAHRRPHWRHSHHYDPS